MTERSLSHTYAHRYQRINQTSIKITGVTNVYDESSVKKVLDDHVVEAFKKFGIEEDHRITDYKIWTGVLSIVVTVLSYYYPNLYFFRLGWPPVYLTIVTCLIIYSIISVISYFIIDWNYKNVLFMSKGFNKIAYRATQSQSPRHSQIQEERVEELRTSYYITLFSKLKASSGIYAVTCTVSRESPSLLWRTRVTNRNTRILERNLKDIITDKGFVLEEELNEDVKDMLRASILQEKQE